jgi:hypothetical protein
LGDQRNDGERNCNSGEGTGQMAQPWMFMMMIKKYFNLRNIFKYLDLTYIRLPVILVYYFYLQFGGVEKTGGSDVFRTVFRRTDLKM